MPNTPVNVSRINGPKELMPRATGSTNPRPKPVDWAERYSPLGIVGAEARTLKDTAPRHVFAPSKFEHEGANPVNFPDSNKGLLFLRGEEIDFVPLFSTTNLKSFRGGP